MCDIDPSAGGPFVSRLGEEQQGHVAGHLESVGPAGQAHAPIDLLGPWLVDQCASDVAQVLVGLRSPQVFDSPEERSPVIPRDSRCLLDEDPKQASSLFGVYSLCPWANPVLESAACPVRRSLKPVVAGRSPDYEDISSLEGLRRNDRLIGGVETVAVAPDPQLRGTDINVIEPGWRKERPAAILGDSNHDVSAIQIVQVVSERAYRHEDLMPRGPRTPRRLEFDALGLRSPAAEEILYVDRKNPARSASFGAAVGLESFNVLMHASAQRPVTRARPICLETRSLDSRASAAPETAGIHVTGRFAAAGARQEDGRLGVRLATLPMAA